MGPSSAATSGLKTLRSVNTMNSFWIILGYRTQLARFSIRNDTALSRASLTSCFKRWCSSRVFAPSDALNSCSVRPRNKSASVSQRLNFRLYSASGGQMSAVILWFFQGMRRHARIASLMHCTSPAVAGRTTRVELGWLPPLANLSSQA